MSNHVRSNVNTSVVGRNAGSHRNVLVVGAPDEEQAALQTGLTQLGCEVTVVRTAEEIKKHLQSVPLVQFVAVNTDCQNQEEISRLLFKMSFDVELFFLFDSATLERAAFSEPNKSTNEQKSGDSEPSYQFQAEGISIPINPAYERSPYLEAAKANVLASASRSAQAVQTALEGTPNGSGSQATNPSENSSQGSVSTGSREAQADKIGEVSATSASQDTNVQESHLKAKRVRAAYLCYTTFATNKYACRLMQACGSWWGINGGEASVHERYRKLLNRVRQGIVDTDNQEVIRWANNAFKGMVGFGDLEGRKLSELVDSRDLPCLDAVQVQLRNGIISPYVVRLRSSGQVVEIDSTPRSDKEGTYMGSVSLVRQANNIPTDEFVASRNLVSLYSLALRLSRAFDVSEVINIITETVREMCDYKCCGIKLKGFGEVVERDIDGFINPVLKHSVDSFCSRLSANQSLRVIKDLEHDPDPAAQAVRKAGLRGIVCVALTVGVEQIGCIWALADKEDALSRENNSFLISVGIQAGLALQNAINVKRRLEEESNRRKFYRDALNALTSGKLVFCERDELDSHWAKCGREVANLPLRDPADVPQSRRISEQIMKEQNFDENRLFDMVTCVSEAATNVVKYGPPGSMSVRVEEDGVHFRLDDVGPGIAFTNLPKAVLLSGYSVGAAPSLGLGYSVMLEMCDCVYLCTGSDGTSLILEMTHKTADPLDAFIGFSDLADF